MKHSTEKKHVNTTNSFEMTATILWSRMLLSGKVPCCTAFSLKKKNPVIQEKLWYMWWMRMSAHLELCVKKKEIQMKDHPGDFSSESAVGSLTQLRVLRDEERRGRMILWLKFKKSTLIPAFLAFSVLHCQWPMSNSFPVFFCLSDGLHLQTSWDNWGLLFCDRRVDLKLRISFRTVECKKIDKYR